MFRRTSLIFAAAGALASIGGCSSATMQSPGAPASSQVAAPRPDRAIRRDIPMTNAIRRAFAAGTRDSSGRPGRNYWKLRTDYTISARLDPATARLTGRETIVVHNTSPDSMTRIGLRLPMNHFLFNVPRAAPWVPAEETDGMVLTRVVVNDQVVDLAAPPRAGTLSMTGLRSTAAGINLPRPLRAGERLTLQIEWNHKVPGGPGSGHRMVQRWGDTLFQPTQWFPRVAMYDDLRGWDTELYLGPSEFHNPFGRYDVSIDVPAGWIVSGTGILQNPQQVLTQTTRDRLSRVLDSDAIQTIVGPDEIGPGQATAAGDRLVWRMVADSVNDFAWATAKKFVWQATRATIPGKGPVPIHMVFLPGRANLFANAAQISRHALEFYSALWFPYQFPQMTLQDGPSAGMEYPMVINSNAGAADHETGHQWWPMVVSTNETWYGWMDEGLNQYMNIASDASAISRGIVQGRGGSPGAFTGPAMPRLFNGLGQSYGRTSGNEAEPPMMWNANYAGPGFYGFTTYSKTPLMLSMLGGIVGDSAVQRATAEWGRAWMFRHPSPWDYMFFMNRALGQDLGWFWYYWLFTTESVDGSIENVTRNGSQVTVNVRQDGQMPSPVVLRVEFAKTGPAIRSVPNARMVDSATALVTFPVDVWFNGSKRFAAVMNFGERAIDRVTLDPDGRFPDRDASDNVWPRQPPSR